MKAILPEIKTRLTGYKRYLPILVVVVAVFYLMIPFFSNYSFSKDKFDYTSWGELLAMSDGRLRPLDTTARTILLLLQGKQTVKFNDYEMSSTEWML